MRGTLTNYALDAHLKHQATLVEEGMPVKPGKDERGRKIKPYGTRTRAKDRTRKGKPYLGVKNSDPLALAVRTHKAATPEERLLVAIFDTRRIGDGMKMNYQDRFVNIKTLFPDAPKFKPKVEADEAND